MTSDERTSPVKTNRSYVPESLVSLPFMIIELGATYILGLTIAHLYVGVTLQQPQYYGLYVTPLLLALIVLGFLFHRNGYYELSNLRAPLNIALGLMKTTLAGFITIILLGFLAGIASEYSRIWFMSWLFGSIGLILLLRSGTSQLLARCSSFDIKKTRIAVIGDYDARLHALERLEQQSDVIEIAGFYSDQSDQHMSDADGNLDDLILAGSKTDIDRIVIAKNAINGAEISKLLTKLSILPSEIDIDPGFLGEAGKVSSVSSFANSKYIRIQQKPISEIGLFLKAAFDWVLAFSALIVLAPVMLIAALAIKCGSQGPVFFRQTRHGYNQRKIDVWKFRTMTVMENGNDFQQASKNDGRVTRIGRFLRRTSIDELPQLFNVLAGDMSIVGPRPHPIALNDDFSTRLMRYNNRHKVKPGITGWAQINGCRGPTNKPGQMDKRIEYDLDYIENWSFWFDLKIILATPYYGLISNKAF